MRRTFMDPVCGLEVGSNAGEKSRYHGKTYYFSSHACRTEFERHPEQYLIRERAKHPRKKR